MSPLPTLARAALLLAAGVFAGLCWGGVDGPLPAPALLLLAAAAAALAGAALRAHAVWLAVACAGAALGAAAVEREAHACGSLLADGERIALEGVLQGLPRAGAAVELRVTQGCTGTVRVRWRTEPPEHAAGARVAVQGRWWAFPAAGALPRRAERRGVLTVESSDELAAAAAPLLRLRGAAQRRARLLFGERAGAVEALTLARRGGVAAEVSDRFARAGLMHLLAISGLHVGLVAGVLTLLGGLLRLPPRTTAIAAAVATVGYVLFIGAPHAAARAGLQVLLLLLARILQRPALPFALLAAAALPLLARDPFALLDPGFQLSFAGTAGIVALRRVLLADWLPPGPGWLRDSLATSVAATLATSPIAALHFGLVAPVGVLANIPAVPLAALAVPAIALALLVSSLSTAAGSFLAGGAALLLAAIELVARAAAAVPYGHAHVPPGALLGWAAAGFAFASARRALARRRVRPPLRRLLLVAAAVAALLAWPAAAHRLGDGAVEIHAIDVGQGDAFAIRSPRGRWILVDAGPRTPRFDAGSARVLPYLQRRGARRLEWLVLTHPDMDHIGGAPAVLGALRAGAVIDPAHAAGKRTFLDVLDAANAAGAAWLAAEAERELHIDGLVLTLLYPRADALDAAVIDNDVSVVFRLEFGGFAALFTGDAPAGVEAEVVAALGGASRVDVLKVGHHGSITSTSEALLEATTPRVALISLGRDNRYGHPHPRVLERLERHGVEVFRTDRHGWIRVSGRADGTLRVRTQRTD
jgi:competence protein ComEC